MSGFDPNEFTLKRPEGKTTPTLKGKLRYDISLREEFVARCNNRDSDYSIAQWLNAEYDIIVSASTVKLERRSMGLLLQLTKSEYLDALAEFVMRKSVCVALIRDMRKPGQSKVGIQKIARELDNHAELQEYLQSTGQVVTEHVIKRIMRLKGID